MEPLNVKVNEKFNPNGNFQILNEIPETDIVNSIDVSDELQREIELYYKKIRLIEILENEIDEFKNDILIPFMIKNNKTSFAHKDIILNRVKEGVSSRFDSIAFRKDHPNLYDKYIKTSIRKGYITKKNVKIEEMVIE